MPSEDPHDRRIELEGLEALVNTAGWARFLEAHAAKIIVCREALEQPFMSEVDHTRWATEAIVLREVAKWPGERAAFLREMLDIGGE